MNIKVVEESSSYIKERIDKTPEIGIILGSGLGDLADKVSEKNIISYSDVPNLPSSTVKGHAGQFVFGKLNGINVVMMQGRFHYYEGNKAETLALPIYIMKSIGVKKLIVTNAAGGVNTEFKPGDLMIINDHINFSSINPLIGKNCDEMGPRFPDMSNAYDMNMIEKAKKIASSIGIDVVSGTYFMMSGPNYETPAEIKMVRVLGGDAVGMSTVPEVIAANHCGMKVIGISCITNMAAGILNKPLDHKEVIKTSNMVKDKFTKLVTAIVGDI
ncbi:purine-nucleoside phosphorylase [Clostridium acetobutylicum]|uniref:Purine nucleoside phosphorylase n=1 Tax=Clostridium acetobutylicum (strain ATCC 824 / DSM 792 / JCM 1419 / IAM 19013 / LMG 5710 / NBRC 13948 / NRRL B-527 / VKM B-1787 / 2291 / W) TaxID=272562 RepID=Q97HE7_CLOAB|nr:MULTISPECIES: purine-nucleoside phosphorylase [Clostridium]AAK80023.1 Purine nucleoside phosphorylase [Clostridium acetobutylicum ATCC 824]ADZ21115.1 purine nucleoside phosphorylase [Clostridium acetobutylicum EA 2018]AEI33579.1 purine nucleoside phosphorylase [Clostridium acetobutylicum DSM 1731]AWV79548.1 purine-nucleoside phosphorylase [Clostridium acetobutylicum]MBC2394478.1 purine-nucleoside phosphorylase [Clostridium acetobutylicum]